MIIQKTLAAIIIVLLSLTSVFAQDIDSTLVTLLNLDLSTPHGVRTLVSFLANNIIVWLGGILANRWELFAKYIQSKGVRVAVVGFVSTMAVGFIFGWTKDIGSGLTMSIVSILSAMGGHGLIDSAIKTKNAKE